MHVNLGSTRRGLGEWVERHLTAKGRADKRAAKTQLEELRHPETPLSTAAFAVASADAKPGWVFGSKDWADRRNDALLDTISYIIGAISSRFENVDLSLNCKLDTRKGTSGLLFKNILSAIENIYNNRELDEDPQSGGAARLLTQAPIFQTLATELEEAIVRQNGSFLGELGTYSQRKGNGYYTTPLKDTCETVFRTILRATEKNYLSRLDSRILAVQFSCACLDAARKVKEQPSPSAKKPSSFQEQRKLVLSQQDEQLRAIDRAERFRDLYILGLANLCIAYYQLRQDQI